VNRDIIVRIGTPSPARFWTGAGDLRVVADDIEPEDGALYLGGGRLLDSLTELEVEQLINGDAARIELGVSGASADTARDAKAEFVAGSTVDIGVIEFDQFWQMLTVTWQARYRADKLSINRQEGQRVISLSMGSDDTGQERNPNSYWTPADQARRSPDDRGFDQVPGINAGTVRIFGPNG
jgi:hypothetical protein